MVRNSMRTPPDDAAAHEQQRAAEQCLRAAEYITREILGAAVQEVAKEDQRPEHDYDAVGFIEGVMFRSHPDVPRGKARFLYPPVVEKDKPLPSGKIISIGTGR